MSTSDLGDLRLDMYIAHIPELWIVLVWRLASPIDILAVRAEKPKQYLTRAARDFSTQKILHLKGFCMSAISGGSRGSTEAKLRVSQRGWTGAWLHCMPPTMVLAFFLAI